MCNGHRRTTPVIFKGFKVGYFKLRAGKKKKREGKSEGGALSILKKKWGLTEIKKNEGAFEGVKKKRPLFFSVKWGRKKKIKTTIFYNK